MNTSDKTRLVTVICWAVTAIALLGLIVWFAIGGIFTNFGFGMGLMGHGTLKEVGSHSVSADNIDSLQVDWISGTVYVGTHSGDEIIITEYARRDLNSGEELTIDVRGNVLTVNYSERRLLINNNLVKELEISIPDTLSSDFDLFKVETISGGIDVSDIQANDFTVQTISGRIELRQIAAPSIDATTVSGRIELRNIQSQRIMASTVSGRVTAFGTEAESVSLQTTSGRIEVRDSQIQVLESEAVSGRLYLSGSFDDVNARSSSGRIEVTSQIVPDGLIAHTSSGRIAVRIPSSDNVSVEYTTSGRFSSEIPVTTQVGTNAQFRLSTGSGRITIYELR